MAETFHIPYLLVLLVLPLLVRWRWGLVASLIVTGVELGLVALIFYLMDVYHLFPIPRPGPMPQQGQLEHIRRVQAEGFAMLIMWGMIPAIAALVGGGLSVVWSAVLAVWRS